MQFFNGKLFEIIFKSCEKSKNFAINAKLGLENGRRRHQRPLSASECLERSPNSEWRKLTKPRNLTCTANILPKYCGQSNSWHGFRPVPPPSGPFEKDPGGFSHSAPVSYPEACRSDSEQGFPLLAEDCQRVLWTSSSPLNQNHSQFPWNAG